MMVSPKEQWRQQISDYEILFIKGGWFIDKSNRPLPFVSQDYSQSRFPHDYSVKYLAV